jgi:4-azaleucine resistance transporter AzlC
MLGYVPIGMAYGLLARQSGVGVWESLGLSVFVYAGAAQFIAVSMLSGGIGSAIIIGAVFIVNFRHVLMSSSLSPMLGSWSKLSRVSLGCLLTDESYVLHAVHFGDGDMDAAAAITLNVTAYLSWSAAGFAGFVLGNVIENPEAWGLDFALSAMFIGLLIPVCRNRPSVTAALCGGGASLAIHMAGAGSWAAFGGALAGATAGVCLGGEKV